MERHHNILHRFIKPTEIPLTQGEIDKYLRRLWKKVGPREEGKCWEWLGDANELRKGYGNFKIRSLRMGAHRASYGLHFGFEGMTGLCVCHRCDNPKCVNPDHLFLGTQADNARDRVSKKRFVGESCHASRLNWETVRRIRAEHVPGIFGYESLAAKYGAGTSTIQAVIERRTWRE